MRPPTASVRGGRFISLWLRKLCVLSKEQRLHSACVTDGIPTPEILLLIVKHSSDLSTATHGPGVPVLLPGDLGSVWNHNSAKSPICVQCRVGSGVGFE